MVRPGNDPESEGQAQETGKASAWGQFYSYCFDILQACPSVRRLSSADREDCVQEVMVEVVRRFGDLPPESIRDTHTGLIRVLGRNKAVDIVRRRFRRPETAFDDGAGGRVSDLEPESSLGALRASEAISLVWEALLGLDQKVPVTSYLVFYLRNIEDWDVPEIAELFGLTHDQVRSRCHRVRKMFGEQLRRPQS